MDPSFCIRSGYFAPVAEILAAIVSAIESKLHPNRHPFLEKRPHMHHPKLDVSHIKTSDRETSDRDAARLHPHRGGLAAHLKALWPSPDLFERLGGRDAVARLIDTHYERIENDPELFHIFRDLASSNRQRQKMFFEEWMGGEPLYSRHVATHGTRLFHYIFPIRPEDASRWLGHFHDSLRSLGHANEVVMEAMRVLGPMAKALVRPAQRGLPKRLRDARGDLVEALEACLADDPELFTRHPADFERFLFQQAQRGRLDAVRYLLDLGVDVNIPTWQNGVCVTPWCIATLQGHTEVADLLVQRGAAVDVFSAAYLGDLTLLDALLAQEPRWLDAGDPASDHQDVPPIYHAIRGGQPDAARHLLRRGARVTSAGAHWVQDLVQAEQLDLALEIGNEADDLSALGPGPWAQYPELIVPFLKRGADVNRPAGDWLRFCAHQVGQHEQAPLVAALLRLGADLEARQDGVSALHLAVRAGYADTVRVLLEGGGDVDAEDTEGVTPLGYLVHAHRRADRPALARLLLAAGADPRHGDHTGRSPLDRARAAKGAGSLLDVLLAAPNT